MVGIKVSVPPSKNGTSYFDKSLLTVVLKEFSVTKKKAIKWAAIAKMTFFHKADFKIKKEYIIFKLNITATILIYK